MKWNSEKDIFALMAGHGIQQNGVWDPGCAYNGYTEAALVLKITKIAVKYLRMAGVKVITDADEGNNKNMKASVAWANKKKARLYMSVHCDYKDATAGVMPLYVSKAGKEMAETVGKSVAKQLGMKWKGAAKRTDLYELNATDMPSVIFETGAIKADLKKLKDHQKYGKALAKAICKYIGVKFVAHTNGWRLRKKAGQIFEYMIKHDFKYQASGNAIGWTEAKKKRTSNCATFVNYTLQALGLLEETQGFWCNDGKIKTKGKGTMAQLKKIATIEHPGKNPKSAKIKKGAICGYSDPAHTQIFAKFDSKDNALWYSWSKSDKKAGKLPRKRGKYNSKKIDTTITLK